MRHILHSFYVITASVLSTAYYASWTVFWQLISKQPRQWTDKIVTSWAKSMVRIAKIDYTVSNPNNVEINSNQPTIIMCNHSSNYDIPLSFMIFPKASMRMLAKRELSRIPVLSTAMTRLEFLFVDRKNHNQAVKDLAEVQKLMKSGIVMWIAPEGTRSRSGHLLKFKKGGFVTAINAKATIIPVGIRGSYSIMKPDSAWLSLNPKAELHIGTPVDASQFSMDDKDRLIEQVREQIAQLSGETKIEEVGKAPA
ncbi:lysophospholipid acyltransferase family protein [Legionella sp. W05-934-2]|jgi:1-acyl-sn-glycerol-3-phosphate acyltransferase|uniref:lysophospholipid acyltransferase family protein n=1 Tax=Legionella sp. W05-934-2 TaxID=1198649 RepID=UPI003462F2A8